MLVRQLFLISCVACIIPAHAAQSIYCPAHHMYINQGMTQMQVIEACGQPSYKRLKHEPVVEKVPMTQLIYTTLNPQSMYQGLDPIYQTFGLAVGSTDVKVEFNVVDNIITGIKLNGSSTNALSVCNNTNVEVDNPVQAAYSACGNPSMINQTFITRVVPQSDTPEVWTFQAQYLPDMNLTFVKGTLQSID